MDCAEKPFLPAESEKVGLFIWPILNDQSSGSGLSAATLAGFFAKLGFFSGIKSKL
jgi:hypothetical protein